MKRLALVSWMAIDSYVARCQTEGITAMDRRYCKEIEVLEMDLDDFEAAEGISSRKSKTTLLEHLPDQSLFTRHGRFLYITGCLSLFCFFQEGGRGREVIAGFRSYYHFISNRVCRSNLRCQRNRTAEAYMTGRTVRAQHIHTSTTRRSFLGYKSAH